MIMRRRNSITKNKRLLHNLGFLGSRGFREEPEFFLRETGKALSYKAKYGTAKDRSFNWGSRSKVL